MNSDDEVVTSSKNIARDFLQRLPDDITLTQVAQEIEFVAAIRQGLAELDRGESVAVEEFEAQLASWIIR